MVDFAGLLDRKYANIEAGTAGENALRQAQGVGITGALGSENALRTAQAQEAVERAKTIGPTAAASIASTQAGIGETQARTGLIGQQGAQIQDELHASPAERLQYRYGMMNGNFGLDNLGGFANNGMSDSLGTVSSGQGMNGVGADPSLNRIRPTTGLGAAGGATEIMAQNDGTTNGVRVGPEPAPVTGLMSLHHVMAHALNSLHAAGGATTVLPQPAPPAPAPGQTTTNGSWDASQVQNPAYGQNQNLRRSMGMVKAAGGATQVNAKQGTPQVPGNGPPNMDSVPATLAPQEAVLNAGAAHHLGRGTIAALNALGAAKMAASGMPPETPPTAHGVPGRGMPPKSAAKGPAKGAPPPVKAQAKPAGKPPFAKKAGAK